MTFKEIIAKIGEKNKERKSKFKELDENDRMQTLLEEKKKSANLREVERYVKEDDEKNIKKQLDYMRKKREDDINYNHNPLYVKNIMNKKGGEVMRVKNMFNNQKDMFAHQKTIHKDNKKLLNNGRLGLCQ